jgi:hypothetical protein
VSLFKFIITEEQGQRLHLNYQNAWKINIYENYKRINIISAVVKIQLVLITILSLELFSIPLSINQCLSNIINTSKAVLRINKPVLVK